MGSIAVALAAQPTVENLIGGLSLFADKPIRVGDYCQCDDALGMVEAIGIRSTRIRELLLGHARVHPDRMRAHFNGFGASSRDIEVFAYLTTRDWVDFLAIREDIMLRTMDVIEQADTAIAFPSQTLYLVRDPGPDDGKARAAASHVRA